jgi:N-methylhydantoinase B
VNAIFDRVANAPKGREGGSPGAAGVVTLKSGAPLRTKGFQIIPDDDHLILELAGGGGMGDPATREPALVARDVRDGLVSMEDARSVYCVALDAEGHVDTSATTRLRAAR